MFEELKNLAKQWLGPLYEPLGLFALAALPFASPSVLNGIFFASAVMAALWFYLHMVDRRSPLSLRAFLRFLLPRRVFLHPSALVDYQFYLINSVFLAYFRVTAFVGGAMALFQISDLLRDGLTALLGARPANAEPDWAARLAFTFAMVMVVDFAKFFAHYLQHKVQLLWEFHKAHHSAEVLTPLTNFRLHPLDLVLEHVLAGCLSGMVGGIFGYLYPRGIVEMMLLNISAIYFVYLLLANLRHSHVPLAFGWRISHVLSSPYMHQIHHSSEMRHWDKNYALIFSFWDALFGSLYVPRGKEEFRLGLSGNESPRFDSVWKLYFAPLAGTWRRLTKRRAAKPAFNTDSNSG